jgi:hypothetical protein
MKAGTQLSKSRLTSLVALLPAAFSLPDLDRHPDTFNLAHHEIEVLFPVTICLKWRRRDMQERKGSHQTRKSRACLPIFWSVLALLLLGLSVSTLQAQVYSPKVLRQGELDSSDLTALAKGICERAGATTPRQKAEAIWRFFLTDGRFVTPGFWYHIAGWAYEEPGGEVLDPIKLLNSYGFGLCYQIAPLLEALYKAAGFEDARVWFLTGHTVTEVFYDGAYHHYDSDMLGYTTVGSGDPQQQPVASVSQIAQDGSIILGKLVSPNKVDPAKVDHPWYPADLKESAIADLAELFTTRSDNWLFPYTRYPKGHRMDFVLRLGEKLFRFYRPESDALFYLPYTSDGQRWEEFPKEVPQYQIRTGDGPQSQRDARRWSTGRIEYRPPLGDRRSYFPVFNSTFNDNIDIPKSHAGSPFLRRLTADRPGQAVFEIRSPYVLIDARAEVEAVLSGPEQQLEFDVSVDAGRQWEVVATKRGPFHGMWEVSPKPWARTGHGTLTAVSGRYGYLVRLCLSGPGSVDTPRVNNLLLVSRFQLNPRALPEVAAGRNEMIYSAGEPEDWRPLPLDLERIREFALRLENVRGVSESGQTFFWPAKPAPAEMIFELAGPAGVDLTGFDAGARFLDLRDGLAPDKLTAEVRKTSFPAASSNALRGARASLSWSVKPEGPYTILWEYHPAVKWLDGQQVEQLLRWPEVDRTVWQLPGGTRKVYIRYSFESMGLDTPRLAAVSRATSNSPILEIIHQWFEDGRLLEHLERVGRPWEGHKYSFSVGNAASFRNHVIIFYCPPESGKRDGQPASYP